MSSHPGFQSWFGWSRLRSLNARVRSTARRQAAPAPWIAAGLAVWAVWWPSRPRPADRSGPLRSVLATGWGRTQRAARRPGPARDGVIDPAATVDTWPRSRGWWLTWLDTGDRVRKTIAPAETIITGTVLPAGCERNTAPARPSAVLIRSAS